MLPGRFSRLKGQDVFLQSLARIKEYDFLAILVGDTGENPSFTEQLADQARQLGLKNKVKLVNYCTEMPAALMLADVVVSATSTEPEAFGRITAEAMAMGKPVIAGTRITVELILEKLAAGEAIDQIVESHPRLSRDAIHEALSFAAEALKADVIYPISGARA